MDKKPPEGSAKGRKSQGVKKSPQKAVETKTAKKADRRQSSSGTQAKRPVPSGTARTKSAKKTTTAERQKPKPSPKQNKPKQPSASGRNGSKLKIQKEPVKRRMNQDEADRTAEKVLERPKRSTEKKKPDPKPLAPPKEPMSPYLRKLRRVLLTAATVIVLLAICTVLSLTVFFKIDTIEVEGQTRYDHSEIISASKIEPGDNLILCNTSPGEKNIEETFPYIEEVSINKKLFNKISIEVREAVPASVVESDGKYIVLSKKGKILEVNDEMTYNVPAVMGAKLKNIKLGSSIEYKDQNLKKYLDRIITCLSELEMDDIKTIDLSNTSRVLLIKNNGFTIILGTFENIEYKLRTAMNILENNVDSGKSGTLDVSLASSDGGKSYLRNDNEASKASSVVSKEESAASSVSETGNQESSEESSESKPDESSEESPEEESLDDESSEEEGGDDDREE